MNPARTDRPGAEKRQLNGAALSLILVALLISGCEPLAVTMAGVGTAVGANHALGGVVYKTFTEPQQKVAQSTRTALTRMGIKVESVAKHDGTQVIVASARDRKIEIELEAISPQATRMRAVARSGSGFWDSATATEIILQTDKALSTVVASRRQT
jgi:hypothetical protein